MLITRIISLAGLWKVCVLDSLSSDAFDPVEGIMPVGTGS